jgi:peptidoglycan/LPS O-acetylase OafA/YrhL
MGHAHPPREGDEEQALHLLTSYTNRPHSDSIGSSDTASLRSFGSSSSSTLASISSRPSSPIEEEKQFNFDIHDHEIPLARRESNWRKTPLTIPALAALFFSLFISVVYALVPSFLQTSTTKKERKIHKTSYLDGLRGIAALVVFIDHFVIHWYPSLGNGYDTSPESNSSLLQLPILRLLYSGRASVSIFFVISGFVLSYKPLQLIRSQRPASVLEVLGSSVFRRGMRLYLPIVVGTFISALLAYRGWYMPVPDRGETIPPQFPTLPLQLSHWWFCVQELVFPFNAINVNAPYSPPYNGHLWTIPIEFYGSLAVFCTLLALSGARSDVRMLLVGGMGAWSLSKERNDLFVFFSGVVLAEISLIATSRSTLPTHHKSVTEDEKPLPTPPSHPKLEFLTLLLSHLASFPPLRILRALSRLLLRLITHFRTPLSYTLLLTSLYTLSYPGDGLSPGPLYSFFFNTTPQTYTILWYGPERFWLSLSAPLILFSLLHLPRVQKAFEHPFCQYLGDISYSLYIVHGMVLFTLGTNLMERWTGAIGYVTLNELGQEVFVSQIVEEAIYGKAFVVCAVGNAGVVVWGADLFYRGVDRQVVRMGRGIERFLER